MRKNQLGLSMLALLIGGALFIVVAMVGMKLTPSYIEFFAIKKAVNAIAQENRSGGSVAEIRKSFDKRATIDDINTIKGSDLEITKDGSELVVVATYRKEIPLVANVGFYIEFRAASKD